MKLAYKIIVSIVVFVATNSAFAQEWSSKQEAVIAQKMTRKLKARGYSDELVKEQVAFQVKRQKELQPKLEAKFGAKRQVPKFPKTTAKASSLTPPCGVPTSERNALIDFYNSTNGSSWYNHTNWNTSAPVCDWHGVIVENGHVVGLTLSSNNLGGSIPESIGQLPELVALSVYTNHIGGTLPQSIGLLTHMEYFNLNTNNIGGSIPPTIGLMTSLQTVYMSFNDLSGTIPWQLGNCQNLTYLELYSNELTGIVPSTIWELDNLYSFSVGLNNLTGSLPSFAGKFQYLGQFEIMFNEFYGLLPSDLASLGGLTFLELSGNHFSGTVPSTYGNNPETHTLWFDNNNLGGALPAFQTSGNYGYLTVNFENNNFRFVDMLANVTAQQSGSYLNLSYAPQNKTDAVESYGVLSGGSVAVSMSADGPPTRYTANDKFQWFKGTYPTGVSISTNTTANRNYTITGITASDYYYCISEHPVVTSANQGSHNLKLVRNPIFIDVNCLENFESPAVERNVGGLNTTNNTESWTLNTGFWVTKDTHANAATQYFYYYSNPGFGYNSNAAAHILPEPLNMGVESQEWLISPRHNIPADYQLRFFTRQAGNGDVGTKYQVRVSSDPTQDNLSGFSTIVAEYTETELSELTTSMLDYEEKIVNLPAGNKYIAFVKIFTKTGSSNGDQWFIDDVRLTKSCPAPTMLNATLLSYTSALLSWAGNGVTQWDIDYGTQPHTPGTGTVVTGITTPYYAMPEGSLTANTNYGFYVRSRCTSCSEVYGEWTGPFTFNTNCQQPLGLVISNLTSTDADISWNPGFATSWLVQVVPQGTEPSAGGWIPVSQATYHAALPDAQITYVFYVKAVCSEANMSYPSQIQILPPHVTGCTLTNLYSNYVKGLLINLINKLRTESANGPIPQGYNPPEMQALAPYITPDLNPAVYNFTYVNGNMNFFFADHPGDNIVGYTQSGDVVVLNLTQSNGALLTMNVSGYSSPLERLSRVFCVAEHSDPIMNLETNNEVYAYLKHINFCPDKIIMCVSHIGLVIDESGSISQEERNRIKSQLKQFINQQVEYNMTQNANIHISLIGMSDHDSYNRLDGILGSVKGRITTSNKQQYLNWINALGTRNGTQGVSPSSDFWNSGLDRVLNTSLPLDAVVMITDGAQVEDPETLIATMKRFNNYRNPANPQEALTPNGPHLYVLGLENGFYIDDANPTFRPAPEHDPNLTELPAVDPTARVTRSLTKSLKYLMGYPNAPINLFPTEEKDDFLKDYFGLEDDFLLFVDDNTYITDNLRIADFTCGDPYKKDFCEDCFSFKPEPGKKYMLSAWVKEQHNVQVQSYFRPRINLHFYRNKEGTIPLTVGGKIVCRTSGEIIDGWQRIIQVFTVPASSNPENNTVTLGIELENTTSEGNPEQQTRDDSPVPVYFDDIRIHPLDGSMKSFVYDPETFKLMSELDENNYATFYEYDNQGGLVRIKKETAKGVKTIQETRSGNVINTTD